MVSFSGQDQQQDARNELLNILHASCPPSNFRVVLEVDTNTENLTLKVLRRTPKVYKVFGKTIWHSEPIWDDRCLQRSLTSRTYSGILTQLQERPEFLEYEMAFEGALEYQVAMDL